MHGMWAAGVGGVWHHRLGERIGRRKQHGHVLLGWKLQERLGSQLESCALWETRSFPAFLEQGLFTAPPGLTGAGRLAVGCLAHKCWCLGAAAITAGLCVPLCYVAEVTSHCATTTVTFISVQCCPHVTGQGPQDSRVHPPQE